MQITTIAAGLVGLGWVLAQGGGWSVVTGALLFGGSALAVAWLLAILVVERRRSARERGRRQAGAGHPEEPGSRAEAWADPEEVRRQLTVPALGLLVTGLLALIPPILLGLSAAAAYQGGPRSSFWPDWLVQVFRDYFWPDWLVWVFLIGVITQLLMVPLAGLMLLGARQMRRRQVRGLAVAGSVLAMLPCHLGWFLGLPAGLWALLLLTRPTTAAAFGRKRGEGDPSRGCGRERTTS